MWVDLTWYAHSQQKLWRKYQLGAAGYPMFRFGCFSAISFDRSFGEVEKTAAKVEVHGNLGPQAATTRVMMRWGRTVYCTSSDRVVTTW